MQGGCVGFRGGTAATDAFLGAPYECGGRGVGGLVFEVGAFGKVLSRTGFTVFLVSVE